MATKKASSAKKTSAKKPATKTTGKSAAVATAATKKDGGNSLRANLIALKPGALIAEFLGTFILAAAIIQVVTSGNALTGNLVILFVLAILVIVFGLASGAHFNPAITLASWINRKTNGVKAVGYIIAQVLGAILAMVILGAMFNATLEDRVLSKIGSQYGLSAAQAREQLEASGGAAAYIESNGGLETMAKSNGVTFVDVSIAKGQEWTAVWAELMGSIIFGLGVGYAVFTSKKRILSAFAIGGSLAVALTIAGATAILNPAVAGALSAFAWANPFTAGAMTFWLPVLVYVLVTTVGLTIGFTVYRFIAADTADAKASK
jgi:glycerol uptake facilitator-like aquaporin